MTGCDGVEGRIRGARVGGTTIDGRLKPYASA